jgi:hypothetical protein
MGENAMSNEESKMKIDWRQFAEERNLSPREFTEVIFNAAIAVALTNMSMRGKEKFIAVEYEDNANSAKYVLTVEKFPLNNTDSDEKV